MKNGIILSVITIISLMLFLTSCGGGGGSGSDDNGGSDIIAADAEASIGPEGGVVEITDPAEELYGAGATIPEGAVSEVITVSITAANNPGNFPTDFSFASKCIDFGPDGSLFDKPVVLTIPYNDSDNDGIIDGTGIYEGHTSVFYYDNDTAEWVELFDVVHDPENNNIQVTINHFTVFGVGVKAPQNITEILPTEDTYYSIETLEQGIEAHSNNARFPIHIDIQTNMIGMTQWNVTFAPMVVQEAGMAEFEWRSGINLSYDEYVSESNDARENEFEEIFWWRHEDRYYTIFVKNAAKEYDFEDAKVIELPYSLSYFDAKETLRDDLIFAGAGELFELGLQRIGVPIPLAWDIYQFCDISYRIVADYADKRNPVVALFPVGIEHTKYTTDSDEEVSKATITDNVEQVSGIVYLDFIKKKAREHWPKDELPNGLKLTTFYGNWLIKDKYSQEDLLTASDLEALPRGKFFVVTPKLDGPFPPLVDVPPVNLRTAVDNGCTDCFLLRAATADLAIQRNWSVVNVVPLDSDFDGFPDESDAFPFNAEEWVDSDGDGIGNNGDICPATPDGDDVDEDGCSIINDSDSDGVPDSIDQCPGYDDNIDMDSDGIPDGCDSLVDSDGDGVADSNDQCPGYDDRVDSDSDGIPDGCDNFDNSTGYKIPDTGQTTSYTTIFGEDSDYTDNPQFYTKLDSFGNELDDNSIEWAMVRDNVTGLMWEVKTDDGGANDKDNVYNWQDCTNVFIAQLNNNQFGGYFDWRMPTIKELSTLIHRDRNHPAINTDYFPNTVSNRYRSSTSYARDAAIAWSASFGDGKVTSYSKSYYQNVRAVRSSER